MRARSLVLALAAALPHLAVAAGPVAGTPGAGQPRIAVLEFTGKVDPALLAQLADEVRSAAVAELRGRYIVMTREAMALLMREMGGTCTEGDCEVETARNVGATLVVTGQVRAIGTTLVLGIRLHETVRGALLESQTLRARDALALLDPCRDAARRMLRSALGLAVDEARAETRPATPAPVANARPPGAEPAAAGPAGCPPGQEGVGGHCCWVGQDWGAGAARCIGKPSCPEGFVANGEGCVPGCAGGRVLAAGHCCWPGQDWGVRGGKCVGDPTTCPDGTWRAPDGCVELGPMVRFAGGTLAARRAVIGPFALDVTEVTVAAYAACVSAGKCSDAAASVHWPEAPRTRSSSASEFCNGSHADRPNHPINCVDWHQATAFCAWAGKRLPTELEWEWAASGAERGTRYPWGNEHAESQLCWNGGTVKRYSRGLGTCAVATFASGASPQGVQDLAGNVSEWTSTADGSGRIYRGGRWYDTDPDDVTATRRARGSPEGRDDAIGFRCAATSP